ncbi:T9SS type A sorting domain-containing protein [Flavobacteriales bacterium]|nr:T9SS type A sorting domain-containing protein [Flavobacteriales bacterium]
MKSKKIIFFIAFFQLIGTVCLAQIKFEISYSSGRNDQARAITQTSDSGYAVVGSTVSYEGNTDIYLLKTDQFGTFLWAKRFGELGMERGQDIIETTDGGLAILGYGHNNGVYDLLFIKTDKNGDSIYTKFIGEIDWDFGYALKQTSDKGFILVGETYKTGNSKAYLVKLDSNGNTVWKKTFGGNLKSKFEDVIIARNGDFVMAGETEAFGNGRQVYLVRTDTLGNLLWEKNYGNPGIDFAKSITQTNNGNFVFAGGTNSPPYTDIDNWAGKIDSLGNLIQNQVVIDYSPTPPSTQNDDWNETVVKHNDSLLFAGQRSYGGGEPGNIYIYRYSHDITPSGYKDDFQKFMSPNIEIAYDSKVTYDNGIIIACTAEFIDSSESNIYLIKLDSTMAYPHPYYNSLTYQYDYTSLSENEKELNFSIYPNPANSFSTINLDDFNGDEVTITVFDSYGKLILNEKTSNNSFLFNISDNNSGIYFVRVKSQQIVITKRLIISK